MVDCQIPPTPSSEKHTFRNSIGIPLLEVMPPKKSDNVDISHSDKNQESCYFEEELEKTNLTLENT